jgi:long-chain fatty acid transport protein
MVLASTLLEALKTIIPPELVDFDELISQVSDKAIDVKQSGMGITPIVGFDFNHKNWNIGVKYEHQAYMSVKNKTKENTSGMAAFDDGVETKNDIPGLLGIGVSYKFLDEKMIASLGYHLFFDKWAKMPNDKQKELKRNSMEILAGLEYVINDKFLVSLGGQYTNLGLADAFQSNMSFYCNSFSVGIGGAYNITEKISLNLAYLYTNFSDYTNDNPSYKLPVLGGKEVYGRTSHAIGIGLDYRF